MSMIDGLSTPQDAVTDRDDQDFLGGFQALESGLYQMEVAAAYYTKSAGGATALNLEFQNETQQRVRQALWVKSGDAKGNLNYYVDKDGNKRLLPGMTMGNALAELLTGKQLGELEVEKRVFSVWDRETQSEKPTSLPSPVDLMKKKVILGVIKQTVDAVKKDDSGNYVPTGETREENEVDKVFSADNQMTIGEIHSGADEAGFIHKWNKKWKGVTRNKAKGASNTAPTGGGNGAAKPAKSLFGG